MSDAAGAANGNGQAGHPYTCSHFLAASYSEETSMRFVRKQATVSLLGAHCRGLDGSPPKKKRKVLAPACGLCSSTLNRPLVCLECPFVGCWGEGHMRVHLQKSGHSFAIDVKSGGVFCVSCDDFIYSGPMAALFGQAILGQEEKRTPQQDNKIEREMYRTWNAGAHESELLTGFQATLGRGRRGLLNLGATCYLSVILQTFIHNPILRNYFLSDRHPSRLCKSTKACVCCEMDKLYTEFYSSKITTAYGPTSFMHAMWTTSTELAGYAQQDAHECYLAALHQIHASSRGATNVLCNCIIHSTFAGQLQSEVQCGECGNVTTTVDPMLDISLDLKGVASANGKASLARQDENTLASCLRRFTHQEKLRHEYQCGECGKSADGAVKSLSFRKLPPVLAFHFKRFEHSSTATKIDTFIRFPSQLNMGPYTCAASPADESTEGLDPQHFGPEVLYMYDLFAVVNHEGKIDTGHYTNFAKSGTEWYRFDDDKVVRTTLKACLQSRAYMCFYVKRHLEYRPYQRPSYVLAAERMEQEKLAMKRDKEKSKDKTSVAASGKGVKSQ